MRANCIAAVEQAISRKLKAPEVKDIEQRITRNLRALAAQDPAAFRAMTPAGQLSEAAARAGSEIAAEHAKAQQRIALTVLAHDKVNLVLAQHPDTPLDGIDAHLASRTDSNWNVQSVESQVASIRNQTMGAMHAVTDYLQPTRAGMYLDPVKVKNFIHEVWGRDSGDAKAKEAAKAWKENSEILRKRFNASGGDIGHLEDWNAPTHHSQLKVAKAGTDAWVEAILPKLDRARYFKEDGVQMNDAEIRATLAEVHQTIATGGLNKMQPGQAKGSGMRANRGNESRFLHFADPQGWLDYQKEFGDQPIPAILAKHVEGMAKDIALTETFGPNADLQYRHLRDAALKQQALADPVNAGKAEQQAAKLDSMYNYAAGKTPMVANAAMAKVFDTLRSWMVATKLGSAVITSITDEGTLHQTAWMNNLSETQVLRNELAAMNPANRMEKRLAQRAGLALNVVISGLNRFGADTLAPNVASSVAQAVMHLSGLPAITEARKRGFSATMMGAIGHVVSTTARLADLHPADNKILLSKGFTEADWSVLRLAQHEDWGGGNSKMLTGASIMRITDAQIHAALGPDANPQRARDAAATKLLGAILEETDVAVIEPGWRTKVLAGGGKVRGDLGGEIYRSLFLFKSFPIAMLQKHMARGLSQGTTGGKAAYIATMIASTTLLGGLAVQINEMLNGRDPRNIVDKRFALQAFLKGGSLGIYGDFLFSEATQGGQGPVASAAGPIAGLLEEAIGLTQGNLVQAALGKKTNAGAEAIKFTRGLIPGQNLWYAKAALDHLIVQQMQELASPGYLARQQRRAQREFGQSYWWTPGQAAPDRAPDLTTAVVAP